jgi:hypothetical protein
MKRRRVNWQFLSASTARSAPVYNLGGGALLALQALKHRILVCSHPVIVSFFFASHSAIRCSREQSISLPEQSIFVHSRQGSAQAAGNNTIRNNEAIIFKLRKRPEDTIGLP